MPFFQRAKPRQATKRKFEQNGKKSKKQPKRREPEPKPADDDDDDQSIDSDLDDARDVPDRSDSEGEHETPQEKKLRLAKLYLEEVEREERSRAEADVEADGDAVADRLRDEYLDQKGRLRREVADKCTKPDDSEVSILRCKDIRLSITCMCLSGDGKHLFLGTKCAALIKWSLNDMKKVKSVLFKKDATKKKKFECHSTALAAVAVSSDDKYLVTAETTTEIQVWNPNNLEHIHTFKGHRDHVTDLVFRKESHQLFSTSKDRTVKVWSLDEMAYVETVFGHQSAVTAIDALTKERAVTAGGRDCSVRIWKIVEESQLIFNGHSGSIDGVKLLNEENFITCGDDGSICVWGTMKKKPLCTVSRAHGEGDSQPRWITCVATLLNSDLIASGSHDGFVRLWKLENHSRNISPLMEIPVKGFINSLIFTPDGTKLIAGVGQEHKLARWWCDKSAKNAIYVIPLLNSVNR